MIAEVDEALCRALARVLAKDTAVRLDPPKPTWQTEKPARAIDLFLFNVAGDPRGAASGWDEVRDRRGRVLSRQEAPRRYHLSYLVTARAPQIADEHELLDVALRALTDGDAVPEDCLPATLRDTGMPVLVELDPAGPGGLWTSLGMPARAAFVLSVSAPYRPQPDTELAPPAESIDLRSRSVHGGMQHRTMATGDEPGDPSGGPDGSTGPEAPKRWKRVPAPAGD